ncbi:hypothetical protein QYF61_014179 [Mycteria americana]|uniref:Uncharacterized protein n=1 Tax=Mycteria americana TaxID=33587 RepID=A0AAN7RVB6_MYCAM|nr:hypothetical protein QYF61_014179 [Mycteria americana]
MAMPSPSASLAGLFLYRQLKYETPASAIFPRTSYWFNFPLCLHKQLSQQKQMSNSQAGHKLLEPATPLRKRDDLACYILREPERHRAGCCGRPSWCHPAPPNSPCNPLAPTLALWRKLAPRIPSGFLPLNNPSSLSRSSIRLVLQTLHQLRCPSLDTVQHLNVSLVVRGPKLNTVFESLPPLKQINTPAQLGVVCKLTEGALDPLVQIIDKDIKQNWPQHRALGNTTCDWPPTGFNSIHHHSLGPAIQPLLNPAKSMPVQATSSHFLQENAGQSSRLRTLGSVQCQWKKQPYPTGVVLPPPPTSGAALNARREMETTGKPDLPITGTKATVALLFGTLTIMDHYLETCYSKETSSSGLEEQPVCPKACPPFPATVIDPFQTGDSAPHSLLPLSLNLLLPSVLTCLLLSEVQAILVPQPAPPSLSLLLWGQQHPGGFGSRDATGTAGNIPVKNQPTRLRKNCMYVQEKLLDMSAVQPIQPGPRPEEATPAANSREPHPTQPHALTHSILRSPTASSTPARASTPHSHSTEQRSPRPQPPSLCCCHLPSLRHRSAPKPCGIAKARPQPSTALLRSRSLLNKMQVIQHGLLSPGNTPQLTHKPPLSSIGPGRVGTAPAWYIASYRLTSLRAYDRTRKRLENIIMQYLKAPIYGGDKVGRDSMKERYPFKEDVICHLGKWTTMERGIQYLRELAVLEVIYDDLDNKQLSKDPDEVKRTRPTW